eukprot:CAMPEP_0197836982 /NCGR_PEP_ID=MMETSP1437-20131217/30669_1 /TAXON_ID=49252 ORGANISM="Eucampia antarctica, Strain CCMP1452" /NCGR_SAMPLE_ID=MMETSP1437 /ASSEMBLY_ACC=CAM_ASM_001096 /LENGTH=314 /DNA_ID=CAMNT_0043443611 /DNA_START=203 /DNA_END=1147 /DNA_ORIENTATION=-
MSEKRKRRSKKPPPRPTPSPDASFSVDGVDGVAPEVPLEVKDEELVKTKARASALVNSQRKSVDTLAFVKDRVSAITNYQDIVMPDSQQSVLLVDDFLGSDDLVTEMESECSAMLADGKLSLRSVDAIGEYTVQINGGDNYADCPRCVEFVVGMTRNMPPLLNEAAAASATQDWQELDATASMATFITFDRKAKLACESLINEAEKASSLEDDKDEKSLKNDDNYAFANGGDKKDARKVTALYFLTPKEWDPSCGGGLTTKNTDDDATTFLPAKNDRLMLFRSDLCLHKIEEWIGKEQLDVATFLVVHLVKRNN